MIAPPPDPFGHPADLARYYIAQAATAANAAQEYATGRRPTQAADAPLNDLLRLTEALVAVGRLALDLDAAERARRMETQ